MNQKPEIVTLPSISIVGVTTPYRSVLSTEGPSNALEVIPPSWGRFYARKGEIKATETATMYGASRFNESSTDGNDRIYLAGAPTALETSVPEGLTQWITPADQLYAKFVHHGHMLQFPTLVTYIYKEWLPSQSEYALDKRCPDVEHYGSRFLPENPEGSEFDFYVPIIKK